MASNGDREEIYQELHRRAVEAFGQERANELESYLRTTAQQVADVESVETDPDLEPLMQE